MAKKIKVYYPKEKVEISLFLKDISTIDFFDYSIPFEKFKENQLIVK